MQMGMASQIRLRGRRMRTTMTSACLPWGPQPRFAWSLVLQCFFRDGVSTKRTYEFR